MTWPRCRDQDLAHHFDVDALPTYLVLDGDGAVRLAIDGTDDQRTLSSRLQDTLKSMPESSER